MSASFLLCRTADTSYFTIFNTVCCSNFFGKVINPAFIFIFYLCLTSQYCLYRSYCSKCPYKTSPIINLIYAHSFIFRLCSIMHPMAENLTNYHFNAYWPKQTTKDAKSLTANEIPRDDRSMNIRINIALS